MLIVFSFLALLAAAAWIDFKERRIPDPLLACMGLVGIAALFMMPQPGPASRIGGIFAVSLPLFFIACFKAGAIGGGDIKLMSAGGLFLGARMIAFAFVLAMLGSGGYSLFLLLKGKGKKSRFALGPFLCAGMAAACIWGEYSKFP